MISHEIEKLLFHNPLGTLQTTAEDFMHPERNEEKNQYLTLETQPWSGSEL